MEDHALTLALSLIALALAGAAMLLARRIDAARQRVIGLGERLLRLPAIVGDEVSALPNTPFARLDGAIGAIERALHRMDHRLTDRHLLSGLPTREPMLALIAEDGGGLLGTIALPDFDRLVAFDVALAEQMVVTQVERVTRMVAGRRMVAQVDRSRLAIWFGPDVEADAARAELDAIGYALGGSIRQGEHEILPEVRIASARYPQDAGTPALLLTRAIASLVVGDGAAASTGGDDPVAVARDRYELEQDLRHAIARGELRLAFQPLIDGAKGRVTGAEALLRWDHPTRGAVPPSRFIPIMESAGLSGAIGLWTLNAAARAAQGWREQGLEGLRVAVNVSGHQLHHAAFSMLVGRTLARHGLTPDALEIELTETVAAGDPARAAAIFEAMRALGIRIAIDDFGTGFSSFSTLRQLRFDKIKIDREFVTDVDQRRDSQAICQSMIALARGLGIRVLAEGVERRAEYEWLRAHGCDHFQGFYFAKPVPNEDFVAFVRDAATLERLTATDPRAAQDRIAERMTA